MRREFPKQVKAEAAKRANGRCEACSCRIGYGQFHYDHDLPDAMGGEPTIENCRVLCRVCHNLKTTKRDVPIIAKSNRQRNNSLGIRSPKAKIPSRGFGGWKPRVREIHEDLEHETP